jgi:methanethiol S-methyltransferase
MMVGFFRAFLATPAMTGGHLLFGLLSCGYVLFGVPLEEHDLTGTPGVPVSRRRLPSGGVAQG